MLSSSKSNIGIIMAGGTGSRLMPLTTKINKHLLPVYNKPMIYYSLSILMLSNIKNIIIFSDIYSIGLFKKILGNGKSFGINIKYLKQNKPNGIPECFILAKKHIKNKNKIVLILGDNLFYGKSFINLITKKIKNIQKGCTFFGYQVSNPENYAVISNINNKIYLEEKPKKPKSNCVVPGIYIFDNNAPFFSKKLKKSKRGELEIIDLIKFYIKKNDYNFNLIPRGVSWLDMGSFEDLASATSLIMTLEKRQNLMICSPHEIAWRMNFINSKDLILSAKKFKNSYGKYLLSLPREFQYKKFETI